MTFDKRFTSRAPLLILLCTMIFLASCKKDDPDLLDQRIKDLNAQWKVSTVRNDNQDVTGQYTGFTLSIAGRNYTTTNGGNPWSASGTYEIDASDLSRIVRSDGTVITIDEITASTLVLSFNFVSLTGGRAKGVTGDFTFSLTK